MAVCCPTINGTAVSYTYDADGLRTTKQVGSTLHEYEYVGDKLVYEKRGNLKFFYQYNALGELASIKRVNAAGSEYVVYVVTNSRGDVEELRNTNGTLYARYVYDSWGNNIAVYDADGNVVTSDNTSYLSIQNPFRYRGYYYDNESGLYYLQSRYYDPVTCRFVNADSLVNTTDVLGFNLYVYCGNNPVNRLDSNGNFWKEIGQAIKKAANWVNNNIIKPIKDCFTASKKNNIISASSHDSNRRPYKGDPGSTYTAPNGDKRTYGSDGTPKHDYDHDDHGRPDKHPHDENGGHNHDWNNGKRGPAYSVNLEPFAGAALVTVCVIGIAFVAADNITGIGVADDVLFGPLGAGVGEGLILIFE